KSEITFKNNRVLLDSLQYKMGRRQLTKRLKQKKQNNLLAFYWESSFYLKSGYRQDRDIAVQLGSSDNRIEKNETFIRLRLNPAGKVMEVDNPLPLLPSREGNRRALTAVFADSQARSQAMQWMQAVPATVLPSRIQLHLQAETSVGRPGDSLRFNPDNPTSALKLSKQDILKVAAFYLEKTGWDAASLQADTVLVQPLNQRQSIRVGTAQQNRSWESP